MFREGNGEWVEGEERLEKRRRNDMRRSHVLRRGMMPSSLRLPSASSRSIKAQQCSSNFDTTPESGKLEARRVVWRALAGLTADV